MIDAYDVLGLVPTATDDEIKKAFKVMSLRYHPDKLQASGASLVDANERFNDIKVAKDILQDSARRKIYDTFGLDLGQEPPENEFWTIGWNTLLMSIGSVTLRTLVFRLALWLIGFWWLAFLLILAGVVVAGLYAADFNYGEFRVRSEEAIPILINVGVIDAVVVLYWLWPLLADTAGLLYLVVEVVGLEIFLESWKHLAGVAAVCFFIAWLIQNWWMWILGLEVAFSVVVLLSLLIAVSLMKLWLDGMEQQQVEKLRSWRLDMRKKRKDLEDEVAELRQKVQMHEQRGATAASRQR